MNEDIRALGQGSVREGDGDTAVQAAGFAAAFWQADFFYQGQAFLPWAGNAFFEDIGQAGALQIEPGLDIERHLGLRADGQLERRFGVGRQAVGARECIEAAAQVVGGQAQPGGQEEEDIVEFDARTARAPVDGYVPAGGDELRGGVQVDLQPWNARMRRGVALGCGVGVSVRVGSGVSVSVGRGVSVAVSVAVAVSVGISVGTSVASSVAVAVAVSAGV